MARLALVIPRTVQELGRLVHCDESGRASTTVWLDSKCRSRWFLIEIAGSLPVSLSPLALTGANGKKRNGQERSLSLEQAEPAVRIQFAPPPSSPEKLVPLFADRNSPSREGNGELFVHRPRPEVELRDILVPANSEMPLRRERIHTRPTIM